MTVEVLLMNGTAVAMAADSAVSIRSNRTLVTQTEAPKIFVLSEGAASGMMTFGLAEFAGCPWPTVVDTFRLRGGPAQEALEDTAAAFIDHLTALGGTDLVSAHAGDFLFRLLASLTLVDLDRKFQILLGQGGGMTPERALAAAIERQSQEIEFEILVRDGVREQVPRPRIGAETPALAAVFDRHLNAIVDLAIDKLFAPAARLKDLAPQLARLVRLGLLTDWMPPSADVSGVVIAGFGDQDQAPAYVELHVAGLVGDLLKFRIAAYERVGPDNPVVIRSFAQNGAVDRFLHGADRDFVTAALHQTYMFARVAIEGAAAQAKLSPPEGEALWALVEDAVFRAAYFGLDATRDAWREMIQDSFGQRVRAASVEPMGRLAGQLLGLPLLESDMVGNTTVSRPFTIMRLSKAGARLDSQMEIS